MSIFFISFHFCAFGNFRLNADVTALGVLLCAKLVVTAHKSAIKTKNNFFIVYLFNVFIKIELLLINKH